MEWITPGSASAAGIFRRAVPGANSKDSKWQTYNMCIANLIMCGNMIIVIKAVETKGMCVRNLTQKTSNAYTSIFNVKLLKEILCVGKNLTGQ